MKLKTINAVICKKFDAWTETITDPVFKQRVRDNTVCTGGAIASMLLNEKPNDFDFYFKDHTTAEMAAKYYVAQFLATHPKPTMGSGGECEIFVQSVADLEQPGLLRVQIVVKSVGVASDNGDEGYAYCEGRPATEAANYVAQVLDTDREPKETEKESKDKAYTARFLSGNAISLRDDVQVVIRFYGAPEEIHANYDFVHATNYWTSWERQVTVKNEALLALMNKELRYIGSRYPLCSLFRVRKFLDRGFKITAGQLLKIAVNLQKYNLLDLAVLESQLTGVDVAYFLQLIDTLKQKGDTKVDENYLMELIDAML